MIQIKLNTQQLSRIKPEMNKMIKAYEKGKPGMLLAQVQSGGKCKVGFVNNSVGLEIQKVMKKKKDGII